MYNIYFREANINDVDELYKCKQEAFMSEFLLFSYAKSYGEALLDECREGKGMFSRDWHKEFCSHGNWTIVIETNGEIIGSINGYPEGDAHILNSLYVHPSYQNKGIGKKAVKYFEALHPHDRWMLGTPEISPKNNYFYQSLGYKPLDMSIGENNYIKKVK